MTSWVLRWLLGSVVAAALVAAGWWAGRVAFVSPADPLADPVAVSYQVVEGSVGRSLMFAAVAEWVLTPIGTGVSAGVVTSVEVEPGILLEAGDVLFTVGLRPVVVAEGSVPAFRELRQRVDGLDVSQLQELLSRLGFYSGDIDGRFGPGLHTAVKSWQESLGVADDGVVRAGDVVFVPELPTRVVLGDEVVVGARLSGGEQIVWLVPNAPRFRIPLSTEQRSLVPLSADVAVTYPEGVWAARIVAAVEPDAFDQLDLILEAAAGGAVCGDDCVEWVAFSGSTDFPAAVVVVAAAIGPIVPTAALGTAADGTPFVTLPNRSTRAVVILGSSDGLAVIDGVELGETILLPFERPAGQAE